MTLVAFVARDDSADIITDTLSYTRNGRHIGKATKVVTIPHLETAIATQGDLRTGHEWMHTARSLAGDVADFDELVAGVGAGFARTRPSPPCPTVAFCVGYSPTSARFRAVAVGTDTGFEPVAVEGLFVIPTPFAFRPSEVELARYITDVESGPRPGDEENLELLRAFPPVQGSPGSPEEWVGLALAARRDRSLRATPSSRLKVFVGGELWHTRLERGLIVQSRTHVFDDAGEEFAAIMKGTEHPLGQLGPCPCGSGESYLECCLAAHVDEPCACGSGVAFGNCCSVEDGSSRAVPRLPHRVAVA